MSADFQLIRQSTIYLLEPLTAAARSWAEEHASAHTLRFGPAIGVEHSCIVDMLRDISAAGLIVDWFEL